MDQSQSSQPIPRGRGCSCRRPSHILVECTTLEASQNMKLDVADESVSLQTTIEKTKLFYIGMNTEQSSSFPIKYVLRKSFHIDQTSLSLLPQSSEVHSTPPQNIISHATDANKDTTSSATKRTLDFQKDISATIPRFYCSVR
ncbi:hypothetical protein BS78_03G172000 [Paspalum vaginatum]|nr:hypothetical protein BS78_03G172000 [Paspalum vaginatum]